ncbi:hypothetical protein ACVILH_006223 [Bradyrhizobium sp. USDA 4353]
MLGNERADERSPADAKSQRPDTPKLVSSAPCAQAHCRESDEAWPRAEVANTPAHQGDCV